MPEHPVRILTRTQVSDAVSPAGWRLVLGSIMTTVPVSSTAETTEVVARAIDEGERRGVTVLADVRRGRVVLQLAPTTRLQFGDAELEAAHAITEAVRDSGTVTDPATSATD